jgi:hypothetical protein
MRCCLLVHYYFPGTRDYLFLSLIDIYFDVTIIILTPLIISYAKKNLYYLYTGLNVIINQFNNFTLEGLVKSSGSVTLRFEQILFAIKHQDTIPLIGVGIGKSLFMPESLYAMYYYRVGLIGMFIHFGLIFYTIYWSLYFAKLNLISREYFSIVAIFFSIALYFVSFIFDYLSSAINDQTRSGFIFYVLIAIVYSYKKHYRPVECFY